MIDARPAHLGPSVRHRLQFVTTFCLVTVFALSSISLASDQKSETQTQSATTTPTTPATPTQSIQMTFPESARVEIYIPTPLASSDADFLTWISGATGPEAGIVNLWVVNMGAAEATWGVELFEPLQKPASDFVERFANSQDYDEKAKFLKALMKLRDQKVEDLFGRERELLKTMIAGSGIDEPSQEAMIENIMLVRRAEAFDTDRLTAPYLTPNILRLLHASASDRRTGPEASAAVRRIALDQVPRVCEQRRIVLDAIAKSGYRGREALARAVATQAQVAGSMASVFRPIALGATRTAEINREVTVLARAELPAEVGDELERALQHLTYGPLADDIFAFDRIESLALPLIPEADRENAVMLVREGTRQRLEARDRILRSWDKEQRKFVERGMVRDSEAGTRFGKELLAYFQSSYRGAAQTITMLGEMAQANPAWKQDAFVEAEKEWKSAIHEQLQDVSTSGMTSSIVPYTQMEALVRAAIPNP